MSATVAPSNFIFALNSLEAFWQQNFGPPPGSAFQRSSACGWEGYVLTCQPRRTADSSQTQPWTYYLDLQYNETTSSAPAGGAFGVETGKTFGLIPPSGAGRTQFLTAMEVVNDAPYAFWFETAITDTNVVSGPPTGASTFKYFAVPMSQVGTPWNTATIEAPTVAQLPSAPMIDFATAVVGDTVYLFTAAQESSTSFTISYASVTGNGLAQNAAGASSAPLCTFETLITVDNVPTLHSIDAAAVLIPDGAGGANTGIAVVATGLTASGSVTSCCWLFNPADMAAVPTIVTVPSLPSTLSNLLRTALRVGWGSLPYASGGPAMTASGLVLVYSEISSVPGDQPWMLGNGPGWVTMIDLASLQAPVGWTSLALPPNPFMSPAGFTAMIYPAATCLFPVVTGNGSSNAEYVLTLMAGIAYQLASDPAQLIGDPYTALQQYPSYKLTLSAPPLPAVGTAPQSGFNDADRAAAVSAWVLLGVVAGLPPSPQNASTRVTIGNNNTSGSLASFTSQVTASVGGKLSVGPVSLSGSISNALNQQSSVSTSIALSQSNTFANSSGNADFGWLIFAQPQYQRGTYTLCTWDGNNAGFPMYLTWCTGTPDIGIYSFDLTDPTTPGVPNDPWNQAVCQFPVDGSGKPLVSWPASNDIQAWQNYAPPTSSWNVTPFTTLPAFTVGKNISGTETLSWSNVQDTSTTATNTIACSTKVNVLKVFEADDGTSTMASSKIGINFATTFSITVTYDGWNSDVQYDRMQITPLFYNCIGDNAPWVPTPFAQQRPWLLTWSPSDLTSSAAPVPTAAATQPAPAPTTIW